MSDDFTNEQQSQEQSESSMLRESRQEQQAAENFSDALQADPADASDYELIESVAENAEETEQTETDQQEESEQAEQVESKYSDEQLRAMAQQLGLNPDKVSDPEIAKMCEQGLDIMAAREAEAANDPAEVEKRYESHYQQLQEFVKDVADPRVTSDFANALSQCKTNEDMIHTLTLGGVNLIASTLPKLLPQMIESAIEARCPGLISSYESATRNNVWDQVRGSDVAFAKLPDLESPELQKSLQELFQAEPWLNDLKPEPGMTYQQFLTRNAKIIAKLLTGGKVNQQIIEKALETGRRQGSQNDKRINSARSMGAGHRTGSGFETHDDDDPLQKSFEAYKRRGGAFGR